MKRGGDLLPLIAFAGSLALIVFGVGLKAGADAWPVLRLVADAKKTVAAHVKPANPYLGNLVSDAPVAAGPLIHSLHDGSEAFLVYGGYNEFRSYCPKDGCVAVVMDRRGSLIHAYPWRPQEVLAANATPSYRYQAVRSENFRNMNVVGVKRLDGGDIIVSLIGETFPPGLGLARIDPNGHPKWYRRDYSHHWPTVAGQRILTPNQTIATRPTDMPETANSAAFVLPCKGTPLLDAVRILDLNGALIRDIPLIPAFQRSPFAAILRMTFDPCDPLHLNYVDVVRPSAAGLMDGVSPGDFVVSLRNISSFGIVDADTGRLKRLFHGGFIMQHAVHHLEGSKFLIFDNWGNEDRGPNARLLEFDAATGAERTIFPRPDQQAYVPKTVSEFQGQIDISPDRQRALVAFPPAGRAMEVSLADGEVWTEFDNLHSVPSKDRVKTHSLRFQLSGVDYLAAFPRTNP